MKSNSKIAAIHQPDFLSYIGFFKKMSAVDTFIYLDNVQIARRGWTHRDRIKTKNGFQWININLQKFKRDEIINNIKISYDENWQLKSLNLIKENYKKSVFYDEIFPIIEKIFLIKPKFLLDFNLRCLTIIREVLKINNEVIFSSDLKISESKNQLLIEILKKKNINKYLSGYGAKSYIDLDLFKRNNIEIIWNKFEHPIYKQQFNGFIKDLSIIDYLFNCGIKNAIKFFGKN
tara:strand:+ start:403 stop:1101 length:699 start_codon:yes stop_codon:yes gene_type:complete